MTIGATAKLGYRGFLGVCEETTYGTLKTATSFVEFRTEGFRKTIEEKIVDSINTTRNPHQRLQLGRSVEGAVEGYLNVAEDGVIKILKQALGGTVTSTTITAGAVAHTMAEGDMESNKGSATAADVKSLTFSVRRGDVVGHTFDYTGCRINSLNIKSAIGDAVSWSASVVGRDATISADAVTPSFSEINPVVFTGVTVSLTGTAEEFTGFDLTINNNLVSDTNVRALGSPLISVLPPTNRDIKLKLTQRFDTTTAYSRFVAGSFFAATILLDTGITIAAAGSTYSMLITLNKVYVNNPGPIIGDKGVIMQELDCSCIADTVTGSQISIKVNNATANY